MIIGCTQQWRKRRRRQSRRQNVWLQVTLSGLNMGGFGIQLMCAHKMKSWTCCPKINQKHPGQPICKMVGGGQLSNVEQLAQNKVDEHRAPGSAQIAKTHHSGLSEVIDI